MNDRLKIIVFSIITVMSLWTLDAAIDAYLLNKGTFPDLMLFSVSVPELYSRLLTISGLAIYGIVISKIRAITEHKRSEKESRANRDHLEKQVAERTEELRSVNELLRNEILDRARTEEELYRSESFLSMIFDSFHDPFNIVDREYKIVKFNDAYVRMKNMRAKELYGKRCYEALHDRNGVCEGCLIEKTFQSADPCAEEKEVTLPNGVRMWLEVYTYPILDKDKRVSHVVQYARDITDRKIVEEEKKQLISNLNYLSRTDGLTGLFNRRALTDTLHHEIDRAQRYDAELSLLLCDIDKFKRINDTYGHAAGDDALKAVSEALKVAIRKADILGRYGGDEFMIILPETTLAGAKKLAEKIRSAVAEIGIVISGEKRIGISLSIGVASCCTPIDDIDTLVKLADTALYTSKHGGRNRVTVVKA